MDNVLIGLSISAFVVMIVIAISGAKEAKKYKKFSSDWWLSFISTISLDV